MRNLARYRERFYGRHLGMVVDSMPVGNTAGRLWELHTGSGLLLALWDGGNDVLYLAGDHDMGSSIGVVGATMAKEVLMLAQTDGVRRLKVRGLSRSIEENVPALFPTVSFRRTITRFAVHDVARAVRTPRTPISDMEILRLTPAVL